MPIEPCNSVLKPPPVGANSQGCCGNLGPGYVVCSKIACMRECSEGLAKKLQKHVGPLMVKLFDADGDRADELNHSVFVWFCVCIFFFMLNFFNGFVLICFCVFFF